MKISLGILIGTAVGFTTGCILGFCRFFVHPIITSILGALIGMAIAIGKQSQGAGIGSKKNEIAFLDLGIYSFGWLYIAKGIADGLKVFAIWDDIILADQTFLAFFLIWTFLFIIESLCFLQFGVGILHFKRWARRFLFALLAVSLITTFLSYSYIAVMALGHQASDSAMLLFILILEACYLPVVVASFIFFSLPEIKKQFGTEHDFLKTKTRQTPMTVSIILVLIVIGGPLIVVYSEYIKSSILTPMFALPSKSSTNILGKQVSALPFVNFSQISVSSDKNFQIDIYCDFDTVCDESRFHTILAQTMNLVNKITPRAKNLKKVIVHFYSPEREIVFKYDRKKRDFIVTQKSGPPDVCKESRLFSFLDYKGGHLKTDAVAKLKAADKTIIPHSNEKVVMYEDLKLGENCEIMLIFTPKSEMLYRIVLTWKNKDIGEKVKNLLSKDFQLFRPNKNIAGYWRAGFSSGQDVELDYSGLHVPGTRLVYTHYKYFRKNLEEKKELEAENTVIIK